MKQSGESVIVFIYNLYSFFTIYLRLIKETKDDVKAGADLQYTNQLINCISLDPKYIQNGWDLNMRLRMEYPEIDDIQNIINRMPSDNARVPNPKEIIVEILKMDCWGIVAHVLIKHGKIKEIKDIIKNPAKRQSRTLS